MNIKQLDKKYILPTYRRQNLVVKNARGSYIFDGKKRYLDFFSGISVNNLGHRPQEVAQAIKNQLRRFWHISNFYYAEPVVKLSRELIKRSFCGRVFFSNSGAEANECAIKLARKYGLATKRYEIIVFENSFHGRTLATLAATGQEKFHRGFEPFPPGFRYARFNDIDSVKNLINRKTVAIMVEPVQGEGGIYPAEVNFLHTLRELADKHRLLLIFDEIQCGMGRTGKLFAFQRYGVKPDIVTLAKALAGGLPLGATIVREKYSRVFGYGDHGSTFGGNPVCCAAALAMLNLIDDKILSNVSRMEKLFFQLATDFVRRYPFVVAVRGLGMLWAIELNIAGKEIVERALKKGLLINCTQDKILRLLPPLNITAMDLRLAIKILDEIFREIKIKK